MPARRISLEKIRRTRVGNGNARPEQMRLVVIFVAVRRLATSPEYVPPLSKRGSGRFDGSIIVGRAVNMNSAVLKRMAT
jgi:hypothetical protein